MNPKEDLFSRTIGCVVIRRVVWRDESKASTENACVCSKTLSLHA